MADCKLLLYKVVAERECVEYHSSAQIVVKSSARHQEGPWGL